MSTANRNGDLYEDFSTDWKHNYNNDQTLGINIQRNLSQSIMVNLNICLFQHHFISTLILHLFIATSVATRIKRLCYHCTAVRPTNVAVLLSQSAGKLYFLKHIEMPLHMCRHVDGREPQCMCGGQRATTGNQFSPSTLWNTGTELRSPGSAWQLAPLLTELSHWLYRHYSQQPNWEIRSDFINIKTDKENVMNIYSIVLLIHKEKWIAF